jgi:hypothetical protein
MSIRYTLTEAERGLLDTARRVLGGNLCELLLSGLGESHHPCRRYAAKSVRGRGPGRAYRLEAVAEGGEGLPGGREPLVMAALLHLMWTGGKGRDEVIFRDEELLEVLNWPDTLESRGVIESAVERYYGAAFRRTSRESLEEGRGERVTSQVQKLVTGYDTTVELRDGPPKEVRRSTIIYFTTHLIEEVTGEGKHFLGIDFERLEGLQLVSPELLT